MCRRIVNLSLPSDVYLQLESERPRALPVERSPGAFLLPVASFLADHFATRDRRTLVQHLTTTLQAAGEAAPKSNHLYTLLDEGRCRPDLARSIAQALGEPSGAAFQEALRRSDIAAPVVDALLAEDPSGRESSISPPCLWRLHERRMPQPLFAVALTGITRWKVIDLPGDIAACADGECRDVIRQAVRGDRYNEPGRRTPFGALTGYLYCPDHEHSYRVATTGRIESPDQGPFNEFIPRIRMGIK